MKRSSLFIVLALLSLLMVNYSCKTGAVNLETPNIIFIMADDLGYGDLGCYGQEIIQTPNIDQLAEGGMKFTRHYAGNTVCAPSRCALMTGKHMGYAEIRGNGQAEPYGQRPISDQALTVAEILKDAGYRTGMIGKWGLGVELNSGDPLRQGFDFYYGYLDQVLAHNYFPEFLMRNGKKEYLDNEVLYLDSTEWHKGLGSYSTEQNTYSHDLMAAEALEFIRTNQEGPFFLYLPLTIPHDNGEEPMGQRMEVPDYGIYAGRDWPGDQKGYAAMISRMDGDVGKIVALLKDLELTDNTLVFFTSDNGPMPDEIFTTYFNSNGPLKGGKRDLYEGGIRVPMIVSWPGKIEAGVSSEHVSAFWDFLPTVCDLIGAGIPADINGISYLPSLLGENQESHKSLYWEFVSKGGKMALRRGDWKLVRNHVLSQPPGSIELYNLAADMGEEENVAAEHPELVDEMLGLMENSRVDSDYFSFAASKK